MRRRLLVAALLIGAVACRGPAKGSADAIGQKIADDIPQIEHALGVKFKTPPRFELRTRDQVREFLLEKVRDPAQQKQIANEAATYKLLGMLPDTFHLDDFVVRVLTEQIVGYYDPRTKVLYIVRDAPEEYVGITIMHELVHALQDQYMNIDSLEHITGDDDREAAVQAVIEGQATYEQMFLMAGGNGNLAAQLPGGWETMRTTIRDNLKTQPIFSSAPMVIQESLIFPYINGADFIRRYKAVHKVQLPIDTMPVSTTQVMHDSAYFGHPPDLPSQIVLPAIAGTIDVNDFGEFGTRLYIFQHTREQDVSIRASNGWDGDRYALIRTKAGDALAWVTVWDTPNDAAEFMAAIDLVMRRRFNIQPRVTGELRHFESPKRTIEVNVREIAGRPVVSYIDVPSGTSTSLLDWSRVKVTPR